MKWRSIALTIATMLVAPFSALPAAAEISDFNAHWSTVQYHENEQVTITCGVGLLCEIDLQPGERVRDGMGSLASMWDNHVVFSGSGPTAMQHIIVKPATVGLHENVILTTSRRVYRLFLSSTSTTHPTYVAFRFDEDDAARKRHLARMRANDLARAAAAAPVPTATPITTVEQACASMKQGTWRIDPTPAEYHPRMICQSEDHTFIALPSTATQPADLPVPLAVTADGDRPVNYRYDATARVFVLDGTAAEYAMVATQGRHAVRMRMQRAPEPAQK